MTARKLRDWRGSHARHKARKDTSPDLTADAFRNLERGAALLSRTVRARGKDDGAVEQALTKRYGPVRDFEQPPDGPVYRVPAGRRR